MQGGSKEPDELLLAAIGACDLEAARAALAAGASPNAMIVDERHKWGSRSRTPALYAAVTQGDAAMVELLLNRGADPNGVFDRQRIYDWDTIPCLVAALPHADIAAMLLKSGANPNLPSAWGEDRRNETSPLAHAMQKGDAKLEGLLRSYGAK